MDVDRRIPHPPTVVRLADLLAGLSRAGDLGFGLQPGEALRAAALALLLADSLDLPADDARAAMYASLLLHVGCIGHSHETADLFGDELAWTAAAARTNLADPRDVITTFLPTFTRGHRPATRLRLSVRALRHGPRFGREYEIAACEVGRDVARHLRMPDEAERAIHHSYERWNGRGVPARLAGDEIPVASRLAVLASVATLFDTLGGTELAAASVRRQGGGILDPHLAAHFGERADSMLGEVGATDPRELVLTCEPEPFVEVAEAAVGEVAASFGDVADLKSPFTHGHARGVAALAVGAAEHLDLSAAAVVDIEHAALLHDVGSVAVPTSVWQKPGSLGAHEWEQVRVHTYHSERILAGSPRLAALAPVVGMHHERLDGGGYHRGAHGVDVPLAAQVLSAADAFHAMGQARPHRGALAPEAGERQLLDDVRAGHRDADAVAAVLAAAGRTATVRRELPAGLSEREVEVLALVASGCTNAQIAGELVISRRTAEHHVQHIYTKIGVSSRAAAAMFAMRHHLLPRHQPDRDQPDGDQLDRDR